jgi:hypothetical protein
MSDAGPASPYQWALLLHEFPPGHARKTHWDLLIREGDILRAWALDRNPLEHEDCPARALPEHRLLYLDWTGTLSGDRGQVTRLARGRIVRHWKENHADRWDLALDGQDHDSMTVTIDHAEPGQPARIFVRRAPAGGCQSPGTNT